VGLCSSGKLTGRVSPLLPVLLLLCSSVNEKTSFQKLYIYSVLGFAEGTYVRSHNDEVCTGTTMLAVLGIKTSF